MTGHEFAGAVPEAKETVDALVLGAIAQSAWGVFNGAEVPFSDGSGGVAEITEAVQDGVGFDRDTLEELVVPEVVITHVFVSDASLVSARDDGCAGGLVVRGDVGA